MKRYGETRAGVILDDETLELVKDLQVRMGLPKSTVLKLAVKSGLQAMRMAMDPGYAGLLKAVAEQMDKRMSETSTSKEAARESSSGSSG